MQQEGEKPFSAAAPSVMRCQQRATQGTNVLKLVVPGGPINNGIIYDYLRLELDEPNS